MNERIQELHEQALKDCEEYCSDILNYHQLYRTRFAELIINECGEVIEKIRSQGVICRHVHLDDHFGVR